MSTLVIRDGRVICPATSHDADATLIVRAGTIAERLPKGAPTPHDATVIDATGCWVMPGGVDLCCYIRSPGAEEEESLAATLHGALRGGVTSVLAMPSTRPPTDGADDVTERLASAAGLGGARLLVAGALSVGREGTDLAEIGEMTRAGALAFTDAPDGVRNPELLRRAMEYAKGFERPVIATSLCPALKGHGVIHESPLATRLGLPGVPEAAETTHVARNLELCRLTGARTHLGPLSTSRALRMVAAAVDEGLPVSAEVHPYHLLLDENVHRERPYDTSLHLVPPLRSDDDRAALIAAVEAGLLSVASGHAPVGREGKELEFAWSTPGAISLPFLLPLLLEVPGLSPLAIARATSQHPAAFLGLDSQGTLHIGARADIVVIDPNSPCEVATVLRDGAENTPWRHRSLRGSVR
ncbi:MAG: dihydroorotase, partial [Myxococcota bacterium]